MIDVHVAVRGCAASFHLKQLAIQEVFDAIGAWGSTRFEIDVQIAVGLPSSTANIDGESK